MTIIERIKKNKFLLLVVLAYIILTIARPALGVESIKNSWYYIKEMLLIMPVIFVLTALLDLWVPKDKIIRYLGKNAGVKGIFLSFAIGSVSAGPIYAAFPMCVMLRRKGASIRNIVIILSSWAVIKIPMLLNEAKYLGLKFMAIRWVLTVIAIIVFSWISAKILKEEDLAVSEQGKIQRKLQIKQENCTGCSICANDYPALFEMEGEKAVVKEHDKEAIDMERLKTVIRRCPVNAIEHSN